MRIPYISLVAASALALGGCAYGDLGYGLGLGSYGYGSPYYGYGGPTFSIGYGTGYSPYYGGFGYSPFYSGFGYGMPYGWYDNYYYPGSGYYVYDVYRQPHVMTTTQRQYWVTRSPALRTGVTTSARPNWSAFNNRQQLRAERQTMREERQTAREQRRQERRNNPGY